MIATQEPPILLAGTSGASDQNPSRGKIVYTIQVPKEECTLTTKTICVDRGIYIIPLEISAVFPDRTITSTTQIRVDLTGGFDWSVISLLGIALGVLAFTVRSIRANGRKKHDKNSKREVTKILNKKT